MGPAADIVEGGWCAMWLWWRGDEYMMEGGDWQELAGNMLPIESSGAIMTMSTGEE
jgi:hypothetical protein